MIFVRFVFKMILIILVIIDVVMSLSILPPSNYCEKQFRPFFFLSEMKYMCKGHKYFQKNLRPFRVNHQIVIYIYIYIYIYEW